MAESLKRILKRLLVPASSVAGLWLGSVVLPAQANAVPECEYNVCSIAMGNCGMTDLAASCKETATEPYCESRGC